MRITNQMSYDLLTSSVLDNQQAVYDTQQQVSSGKRVATPSDDPVDFGRLARMRNSLAGVRRYATNIAQAQSEMNTVDNALQQVNSIFQRASEIAVSATDDTKTSANRQSMGEEVDGLLNELLNIANTTHDGHTVFSGVRGSQQAYVGADTNGDGRLDTFTYQGGTGARDMTVSENSAIEVGVPGTDTTSSQAAFQTNSIDLFASLQQLRDQLLIGNSLAGTNTLSQLQDCQDHVSGVLSMVGGRGAALSVNNDVLSKRETDLTSDVDNVESLDIAKAMMALTNKQQAYQAALSATAGLNKNTLIDWLK